MKGMVTTGLASLLDAFMPPRCLHCLSASRLPGPLCLACFRTLERCSIPPTELPGFTVSGRPVLAVSYYRSGSPLRAVHRAAKYEANAPAADWLARYMARRLCRASLSRVTTCTPVPSHPARLLDRGLNISMVLAEGLASHKTWSLSRDLLIRRRLGIPQNELGREQRLDNVMKVFRPGPGVGSSRSMHILLVDDVVTTGATLDACASILESHGHLVRLAALAFRRELFNRRS